MVELFDYLQPDKLINLGSGLAGIISTIGLLGIVAAAVILWYKNQGRYNFKIVIWELDKSSKNLRERYDKGGIFIDKDTNNKRLWLKKSNVGLECDAIPWIYGEGGQRIIYLLQKGLKNYEFCSLQMEEKKFSIKTGEEDVNWAINAYEKQKKLSSRNWMREYLPFISLIIVCFVILILFYFLIQKFEVLKETAEAFTQAAQAFRDAKAGTVVLD